MPGREMERECERRGDRQRKEKGGEEMNGEGVKE